MARAHVRESINNTLTGLPISNAVVTVREVGTTTALAATMRSAKTGGTTVSNPITTGPDGKVEFWLDVPQNVDFRVVAAGYADVTISDIPVHYDQADLADKTSTQTLTNKTLTSPTLTTPTITSPTFSGAVLIPDGTVSAPGIAFASDTDNLLRRVSADYWALVAGGADVIRMRKGTKWQQVGLGNVGEPGVSGAAGVLWHVHHQTSAASDGDLVGSAIEITNNASSGGAGAIPDSSAASLIIYQTAASADGAIRALEAHAIVGHASAGASANSTRMGAEIGIHSLAAGNASFGTGSAAPKNVGIYLGSYSASGYAGAVRADVGYYLWGAAGFKYGLFHHDTNGDPLVYTDQVGRVYAGGGAAGSNAAAPTYGFVVDVGLGMYRSSNDVLAWAINSAEAMRLDASANLGVGGTAPSGSRIYATGGLIEAAGGIKNGGASIEKAISPTALGANTNNYAPTGGSAASIIQVSASTPINITGLDVGQTVSGHRATLYNGGANAITLSHVSGSSATANQFVSDTGANFVLAVGKSKSMFWNGVWWILIG